MKHISSAVLLAAGSLTLACVVESTPPQNPAPAPTDAPPAPAAAPAAPVAAAPAAAPVEAPPAEPAAPQPAFAPPAQPVAPGPQHPIAEALGRPAGYKPGHSAAYWLWHDGGTAETWHLRSTTAGLLHRFHGRIWSEGGTIADLRPSRVEYNDRIRLNEGRTIAFDFSTKGNEDGLDFRLIGGRCLSAYLLIDDKQEPEHIFLGGGDGHPKSAGFGLCR